MDSEKYTVEGQPGCTYEEAARMAAEADEAGREIEILDADGEEMIRCIWCGELWLKSETVRELQLGRLCRHCAGGIRSRGEKLVIEDE